MENSRIYEHKGKKFRILIPEEKIQQTVAELAARITNDYRDKHPIFLIILKGSIFFAADLLRKIDFNTEIEVISAKSYGQAMSSNGNVNLALPKLNIEGKDVLIIEDIVDTGYTIQSLIRALNEYRPNSIETVAFLSKTEERKVELDVKYIGIEIPSEFAIGYGLDFAEFGRNLPAIYSNFE